MTIQTSSNVASFNGDGANKAFPIGYKFNSAADLVVLLVDDKADTTKILTLNSDFTVTGAGDEEGGTVTLKVAPTANQRLIISRIVDILQLTDLRNQGKFYAETHEDALDLLTMIAQQHQSDIDLSLRVAETDPEPARIPSVAQRAGKLLAFDSAGNPTTALPVADSSTELRQALISLSQQLGVSMVAGASRVVATIADLKTIPTLAVPQSVRVVRYSASGPTIDSPYDPDPTDTTTVADDCLTVRTSAGMLYRLRHRGVIHLAQAGGIMDGTTNDTVAWNKALATGIRKIIFDGVSIVSSGIVHPNSYCTIEGLSCAAVMRSQGNTNHECTLRAVGKTGIKWTGFTVDANSPNRMDVLSTRTIAGEMNACNDCYATDMTFMNAVGSTTVPGIGFSSGGAGNGVHTLRCKFIDCGITGKAADGIFCGSFNSTNVSNVAIRCNDTGHVVESCSNSGHTAFTSIDCGAAAAISNAISDSTYGQYLRGGSIQNWTASVTGGIQILAAAAGNILDFEVSDITMSAAVGGVGPAINLRETSTGRINGGTISNPRINGGTKQGILVSGVDISIVNPSIKGTTDSTIQATGTSTVNVSGGTLAGGTHGVAAQGTSRITLHGVTINSPVGWGGFAYDTSTIIDLGSYVVTPGSGSFSKDAGASLNRLSMDGGDLSSGGIIGSGATGTPVKKLRVLNPANGTEGYIQVYPS